MSGAFFILFNTREQTFGFMILKEIFGGLYDIDGSFVTKSRTAINFSKSVRRRMIRRLCI